MKESFILILLLPLLIVVGGIIGGASSDFMAGLDDRVLLARDLRSGKPPSSSDELIAFLGSGTSRKELFNLEDDILGRYRVGSIVMGIFIGLVIGLSLIKYNRRYTYKKYEPDKSGCVSCGRCFEYCPQEVTVRNIDEE